MSGPTRRARPRRILTALAAMAALLLLLALGAAAASAHATLELVDPPDGSTLGSSPTQVRMVFSEAVSPSFASVQILDGSGAAVEGTVVTGDPNDRTMLLVSVPKLGSGAYRLAWHVIDEQDLHVTQGTIVFGVGTPAPASVEQTLAATGVVEAAFRWLVLGLLASACGSLLVVASLRGLPLMRVGASASSLSRRLMRLASISTLGALLANAALFVTQVAGAGGLAVASVLTSVFGLAWLAQEAILIVLLVAIGAFGAQDVAGDSAADGALPGGRLRQSVRRWSTVPALALVALLAAVVALTGHVATGAPAETPWRWAALSIHLAAMLAWAGGLLGLSVAVGPLLRGASADRSLARAVLARFWRVAAPSLAALAVTGIYLGGQLVASLDGLLLTTYGQALMVKSGLVVVTALLGLRSAAGLHPGLRARLVRVPLAARLLGAPAGVGRTIALEAVAVLGVVLAASVMGSSPPAVGPQFEPAAAQPAVVPAAARADDLMITVSIRPDRPGPNFVDVAVLETRRPAPGPIESVSLRLVAPSGEARQLAVVQTSPGHYLANDVALPQAGEWQVEVGVARTGLAVAAVSLPWSVPPGVASPHAVLVSDGPLAPLATPLALGLALLLAAGGAMGLGRRRLAAHRSAGRGHDDRRHARPEHSGPRRIEPRSAIVAGADAPGRGQAVAGVEP